MSEQTRRLVLGGATTGVVTRCRDFTRRALTDWQWLRHVGGPYAAAHPMDEHEAWDAEALPDADREREEAAEDVLLLVSELITNACMHAGGPQELVLRHDAYRLRVEVSDGTAEPPRRRVGGSPALPGGHGLVVLERLARNWGWVAHPEAGPGGPGKTVWLEVASPLTPATTREGARGEARAAEGERAGADPHAAGPAGGPLLPQDDRAGAGAAGPASDSVLAAGLAPGGGEPLLTGPAPAAAPGQGTAPGGELPEDPTTDLSGHPGL
ncbi:ATP-binding protein [Streptomyces sp. BI20]|uniref:ATP-binding protein n=1 Tax=Streptomyces sp. BI20 TaxID=3403460 RepID=UPI003C71072C